MVGAYSVGRRPCVYAVPLKVNSTEDKKMMLGIQMSYFLSQRHADQQKQVKKGLPIRGMEAEVSVIKGLIKNINKDKIYGYATLHLLMICRKR